MNIVEATETIMKLMKNSGVEDWKVIRDDNNKRYGVIPKR